jgi:hypothetical protein
MPRFAFEVARREGPLELACELSLPDDRGAWRHVEALAFEHKDSLGSYILVKDENGGVIIRAGISTALQSIQRCRRANCALKRLGARCMLPADRENDRGEAPCFGLDS